MIKAWRIVKARHKKTAFTGNGCQFASGRWHDLMVPVVYCSDSQALAALETFVHVMQTAKQIQYVSFELVIPKKLIAEVESVASLPTTWWRNPPGIETKAIGSSWVQSNASAVLSVPSTVAPAGRNYLLNPAHVDFDQIQIKQHEPFSFDTRLWK